MSARVCQLCGKALSRIRVGTEGDFCSREHRNQYRLRQGMDRLMEANNVANLMRRREMPKMIVPKELDSRMPLEPRSFGQGPAMPGRPGVVTKEMRIGGSRGKSPSLTQSRRAVIALVRFNVLETQDNRRDMKPRERRGLGLYLAPKARRGGVRSSERAAAASRRVEVKPQRGEMLRVSGNAGFALPPIELRHVEPLLATNSIQSRPRKSSARALDLSAALRPSGEQWSALYGRLHVAAPEFSRSQPWSGLRLSPRDIPGTNAAAGAVPGGPVSARVAQVRIELQEGMRYAISSEEDRG